MSQNVSSILVISGEASRDPHAVEIEALVPRLGAPSQRVGGIGLPDRVTAGLTAAGHLVRPSASLHALRPGACDAIVLHDGLSAVPDLEDASRRLADAVAPGGLVAVVRRTGLGPGARASADELASAMVRGGLSPAGRVPLRGHDLQLAVRDAQWGDALSAAMTVLDREPRRASRMLRRLPLRDLVPIARREVLLASARILGRVGELGPALELASEAQRADRASGRPLAFMAEIALRIGDPASAVDGMMAAVDRDPESNEIWRALAEALEAAGDATSAAEAVTRALERGAADARTIAIADRLGVVVAATERAA